MNLSILRPSLDRQATPSSHVLGYCVGTTLKLRSNLLLLLPPNEHQHDERPLSLFALRAQYLDCRGANLSPRSYISYSPIAALTGTHPYGRSGMLKFFGACGVNQYDIAAIMPSAEYYAGIIDLTTEIETLGSAKRDRSSLRVVGIYLVSSAYGNPTLPNVTLTTSTVTFSAPSTLEQ